MEITLEAIISLVGLFIGGSGGAFFTWRYLRRKAKAEAVTAEVDAAKDMQDMYQQMLQDAKTDREDRRAQVEELRQERDHYKQDRNELRERLDKTDKTVRDLQEQVARNGRMVASLRPLLCYDMKCKRRVRVAQSEPVADDCQQEKHEIDPIND